MKAALARWALQILVALDQLACALCGGWADETCSSYLFRLDGERKPWGRALRPVVDWIALRFFGQPNHCWSAYQSERRRADFPPELRPNTPRGLPPAEGA